MKTLRGKRISPGYARGQAVVLGSRLTPPEKRHIETDQVDDELHRLRHAVDVSRSELSDLRDRVQSEFGSATAEIFSAHLMFLDDQQFIGSMERAIKVDHLSVESAVQATVDELNRLLGGTDNAYLRERAGDFDDLGQRLLRHASESPSHELGELAPESVLIARELLPSDLLEVDRDHLVAVVTELGGETSHAAILARSFGIPAVTGIDDATNLISPGTPILVDGEEGLVVLEPREESQRSFRASKANYDAQRARALDAADRRCETRDGVTIRLLANIGVPVEARQVAEHHLDGVGLFRTEYLFLSESVAPSFEDQVGIYSEAARALKGLPLVIRTLDFGGDKWPVFLKRKFEANPNLGMRGLRYSLMVAEDLFRTQIRAILHAGAGYNVRIMLPMVVGPDDLAQARQLIDGIAREENIKDVFPVGTLIETPSAVFTIDEIVHDSDFISIGTNDLTQFVLAADRNALALIDDYTVLHPSVLRAVRTVLDAAAMAGKNATICGEAASDPRVACLLIGLGARQLSMSAASAAGVRYAVRASDSKLLEALADDALSSSSAQAVSKLVTEALQNSLPGTSGSEIFV